MKDVFVLKFYNDREQELYRKHFDHYPSPDEIKDSVSPIIHVSRDIRYAMVEKRIYDIPVFANVTE